MPRGLTAPDLLVGVDEDDRREGRVHTKVPQGPEGEDYLGQIDLDVVNAGARDDCVPDLNRHLRKRLPRTVGVAVSEKELRRRAASAPFGPRVEMAAASAPRHAPRPVAESGEDA